MPRRASSHDDEEPDPGSVVPLRAQPPERKLTDLVRRWLPTVTLIVVVVGSGLMVWQLLPTEVHLKSDAGLWDVLFASRLMVLTARVAFFVAAVYFIGSVVALIARDRWLSDFGPFKVRPTASTEHGRLAPTPPAEGSGADELQRQRRELATVASELTELDARLEQHEEEELALGRMETQLASRRQQLEKSSQGLKSRADDLKARRDELAATVAELDQRRAARDESRHAFKAYSNPN